MQHDSDCTMIHGTDKILKFYAWVIMRIFYISKIRDNPFLILTMFQHSGDDSQSDFNSELFIFQKCNYFVQKKMKNF